jgi:predicted outer membrane repeat protein
LYSAGNTTINIDLSKVHLESNTAAIGGTFYGQSGTTFTFTAENSNISNSTASYDGGFIALGSGGYADFSATKLNASSNAAQHGGFMYLSGAGALFGDANFINNTAEYGGAIYALDNSTINFTSSTVHFTGNIALSSGGAIYNAGVLNLRAASGSTITFVNNRAVVGKDIYGVNGSVLNINGLGDISFGGGIEGYGEINKTNTGNVYFEAGSKTDFQGKLNINEGMVYFSTSVYIRELNIGSGGIGIDADLSAALGAETSYIYTATTTITEDSKLYVNEVGLSVVGSSTAIMFAGNTDMVVFSTSNIIDTGAPRGYKFVWESNNLLPDYNFIGWLVYGSSPWNAYVAEYQRNDISGQTIYLATDIKAADDDEDAFGSPASNNFTLAGNNGNMYVIDADGRSGKGLALDGKTVTIKDLTFKNFERGGHGGVIQATNSNITFEGNGVNFTSNTAVNNGGAISAIDNSKISFTSSTIDFTSNTVLTSGSGGAIYAYNNSSINFTSAAVNFTSNTAGTNGGAISAVSNSKISFTSSMVDFTSNTSVNGGAIHFYNTSNLNITSSTINFISNKANLGGAIVASYRSNIDFTSSTVSFTSNTAIHNGGAIYDYWGSNINFTNSIVSFTSNTAGYSGGAIFVDDASDINFTGSTINFTNNRANDSGGAIYNNYNDTVVSFIDSNVSFTSNTAENYGGAIYNSGLFNLGAAEGSTITFVNNSAAAAGNDIYGYNNSVLNINGLGDVVFGGGIEGEGTINKTNSGEVYFEAGSKTDFDGKLNINEGMVYFSTSVYVGELNIGAGGIGVEADFSSVLGAGTSFIYTATTTLTGNAQLYVNKLASDVAGSSTAVMFAQYSSGTFETSNVRGDVGGYRFVWAADNLLSGYTYTGWLLYSPWNYVVEEYTKAGKVSEEVLYITGNIKAADGDENPFGPTDSNNFTIAGDGGNVMTIDADGRSDKGFNLSQRTVTIKDLTFQNFIKDGSGAVIVASNANITFGGDVVNFTNNTATSDGGVIDTYNSNINFTSSTVNFTSNTAGS